MQFSQSLIALVATLTFSAASPVSMKRQSAGWQVTNQCTFDIYFSSVDQEGVVTPSGTISAGTSYGEAYAGENDGLSVKLCSDAAGCASPYQLETTVKDGGVYYDLSALNGDPFTAYPRSIGVSDGSGPTYSCAAGDDSSCGYYQDPNDNRYVGEGNAGATTILTIC